MDSAPVDRPFVPHRLRRGLDPRLAIAMLAALAMALVVAIGNLLWPGPTPEPTPLPQVPPLIPPTGLVPVDPPSLADDGEPAALAAALAKSLEHFARQPAAKPLPFGTTALTHGHVATWLGEVREALLRTGGNGPEFLSWLAGNARFFQATASPVTFTGYFLPSLQGSRKKSDRFRHPLYRRPDDLVRIDLDRFHFFADFPGLPRSVNARVQGRTVVPYHTRGEIDFAGALAGKGLELVWVDSLVDAHTLHVQGSGVIELDDGSRLLAGFADSNGHKFRGVGEVLLTEGILPPGKVSYREVQDFLRANPHMLEPILTKNARYIFFRALDGGPQGSLGVEITPHRSIATDPEVFPPGALALIETDRPVFGDNGRVLRWETYRRLVLNQDMGAAIKGPGRVDLYHGFGADNERLAGALHRPGKLWFLAPR